MNWLPFACGCSLGFGLGVLLAKCWPRLVQAVRGLRLRLASRLAGKGGE